MAMSGSTSNEQTHMNPLLTSSDSQDQQPGFPQTVRPPFPHPHGVQLTPPVGAISPGGGPLPPHPLSGLPPMMPPHPLPGLPPPGLPGLPPPRLDAPPPMGIPRPPMMIPNFPIPPSSQPGGPILMTPPPRMGPPHPGGPLLMTPPTTDLSSYGSNIHLTDNSPNQQNDNEQYDDKKGEESQEVWVEHRTADGSFYYSDPKTRKTTWNKPTDVKIIRFAPPMTIPTSTDNFDGAAPNFPGNSIPGLPPGIPLIPQRVWSEHDNPEGKTYYYNKVTRQSVWNKPKDLELIMPLPADLAGPHMVAPTLSNDDLDQQDVSGGTNNNNQSQPLLSINDPIISPHIPPSLISTGPQTIDRQTEEEPEMDPKELLALVASKLGTGPSNVPFSFTRPVQQQSHDLVQMVSKGPKPTISVPIPGTPWSIVYTNDEKMFFFDATSRKSFWDLPPELERNPQVFKIIENPPWKKKRVGAVEEPASKRIKFDDEDGDSFKDEVESMEVQEGRDHTIVLPLTAESKNEKSSIVSREAKMAKLRATLPFEQRQQSFKIMLLERQVSAFSTWEKELPKFVFDDRFHLLLPKERKTAFDEFILTRTEEEMKEKKQKLKERKELFQSLLKEAKITKKTTFSEFNRMYGKDERFKAIDKMRERESLFQERISELKKINKQKENEQKMTQKNRNEKVKTEFVSMLSEVSKLTPNSEWRKVKVIFQKDKRYQIVDSSSQREEYFIEYIKQLNKDDKQDMIQASLREREREVELSRTAQREQWGKERDLLKRTEAETSFSSMLVDLVKDPSNTWGSMKKTLRRDHRWEMCEMIETEEKETMFREHINKLEEKRRIQFRNLLEETSKITLMMPWKKARKLIKDDPRYKKYSDSDEYRESEYERHLRDKLIQSKNELKSLLKETKLINYKTKGMIDESEKHLKDIINILEKDQRYLILECIKNEREDILMDYITDLQRRGPPPPPTATHPSERLRK